MSSKLVKSHDFYSLVYISRFAFFKLILSYFEVFWGLPQKIKEKLVSPTYWVAHSKLRIIFKNGKDRGINTKNIYVFKKLGKSISLFFSFVVFKKKVK